MNTYHALEIDDGRWVVGWWVNAVWQGPVWGKCSTEAEAAFYTYTLALMEIQDWKSVTDSATI